jgi:hypothetical protein
MMNVTVPVGVVLWWTKHTYVASRVETRTGLRNPNSQSQHVSLGSAIL